MVVVLLYCHNAKKLLFKRNTYHLHQIARNGNHPLALKLVIPNEITTLACKNRVRKIHWSHAKPISENEVSGGTVPVNLADGMYDEKRQSDSFQAAVMQWRTGSADSGNDNEDLQIHLDYGPIHLVLLIRQMTSGAS